MIESTLISTLGDAAVKAAAILGIAGIVTAAWKSASAATRHLIWTLAVCAALGVPAINMAISRFNAPQIEVPVWTSDLIVAPPTPIEKSVAPVPDPVVVETEPVVTTTSGIVNDPVVSESRRIDWLAIAFPLWLAGFIVTLLPVALAQIRTRLLARTAAKGNARWNHLIADTPAIARFSGKVRILESSETAMPMTWGIIRPTLLVPARADRWPDWQCRDILLHELAHVDRRDCLTQLVAQFACAVYWFNPLAWVASHRMRVERELACDDRVINAGSRATDYASNLLEVARSLRAPSMTSHTAIAMARPSQLSGRLLAVLDNRRNRRTVNRRVAAGTSFAAIAIALSLASLTPASAAVTSTKENSSSPTEISETTPTFSVASANLAPAANSIVKAIQLPAEGVLTTSAEELAKVHASMPLIVTGDKQDPVCWDTTDGKTNVSINSNNHDRKHQTYTVQYSRDNCSLELRAEGDFTLRADLSDIESIGSDGWVRIEERVGRASKRVEVTRADNGTLEHKYWVNGDRTAFDADARAWLARTLLSVERRTAFAADTRVPQLYRSGGLNAVLREIGAMSSAYPKSKYYGTLLDMGVKLDTNTLNSIVRQASTDLASSDYYMSEVLGRFASQGSADETTWRTFAEVAGRMKSDYYTSVMLKKVLSQGRLGSQTVGILLRSASGIKSDYYLSDLLKEIAGKYALNADTRQFYVDALRAIESDYYRYDLLKSMGTAGDWDARTTAFVLQSASGIKSDYYKSESLRALAKADKVADWPTFFSATSAIGSDYYKKETLRTALNRTPLTRDVVAGALDVARNMRSDSEMADVLAVAARNYRMDDNLRAAYEKAVDAMSSDYYRGAALSALRRSVTR